VLSHGREIGPSDLPRQIREGGSARFLPVHVGPAGRGAERVAGEGRELEFILRSLLELKLQMEELRRQVEGTRGTGGAWDVGRGGAGVGSGEGDSLVGVLGVSPSGFIGEVPAPGVGGASPLGAGVSAIGPRDESPPPNVVTIAPGTRMTEVERAVIEAALKETRGNRRRAADLLGIGERTLYRKIKEYRLPELEYSGE
jgi:hypothetical protein